MRMILLEMKKIWNWKILGAIALVCASFYFMFMSYYINYYKSGNHPQAEIVYYAEELARLYGTTITPEELSAYIAEEREKLASQAENAHSRFFLETLEHMEEVFDTKPMYIGWNDSFWEGLNEREQARYTEIVQNNEHHSVFSYWTHSNTEDYAVYFAVMLMLAVLILVSPFPLSDRHANIHHLQYSAKLGRKIMHRQLAATLLSAFMLTTLLILIFGGVYSVNSTYLFWNANINSGLNTGNYSVFSMTYGQWVMAMIAMMYILALGISMFAFVLSRFSRNMITLIMKLIPLFAATAYLCMAVFNYSFSMLYNALYNLVRVFGTEAIVCGVVMLIGFTTATFVVRREKRVDVI